MQALADLQYHRYYILRLAGLLGRIILHAYYYMTGLAVRDLLFVLTNLEVSELVDSANTVTGLLA